MRPDHHRPRSCWEPSGPGPGGCGAIKACTRPVLWPAFQELIQEAEKGMDLRGQDWRLRDLATKTRPRQVGERRCRVRRRTCVNCCPQIRPGETRGKQLEVGRRPMLTQGVQLGQVSLECQRDKQHDRHRLLMYSRIHSSLLCFSNGSLPVPGGQKAAQLETTYGCIPGSQVWPHDQFLANNMWAEVMYVTSRYYYYYYYYCYYYY